MGGHSCYEGGIELMGGSPSPPPPLGKTLHLPCDQFLKAKQVLSDFKDVFSVLNTQIGHTNISSFDVELEHNHPISMLLQRVPLHQLDIVCSLLQQYKDLGLIEHIDSPYCVATVLVVEKNVSNSSHLTDKYMYHLVVDY